VERNDEREADLNERLNRRGNLNDFVAAARRAAEDDNWFAALPLALTLPDICGAVDDPGAGKSKKRYIEWWDTYMAHRYWVRPDKDEEPRWEPFTYLPGPEAYALRCAYLHSGTDNVEGGSTVLHRIRFLGPPSPAAFGYSVSTRTLNVGLEQFVEWVCQSVEQWMEDRLADDVARERLNGLVSIIPSAITVVGRTRNDRSLRVPTPSSRS
jgi:hypothetical protein